MEVPKNLVEAVGRLKPKAILLLDTNILMNPPRLDSYEIAAPGRFLLVVPRVVYNELMAIKLGSRGKESVRKAVRALGVVDNLYERNDPVNGFDIGNDRWLITAETPPTPNDMTVEDKQVHKNLGAVDAALLRLSDACSKSLLESPTLLVTEDRNLTGVAKSQGLPVCQLSSLRSPGALKELLVDDDAFLFPDPDEGRPVKIVMTLEELRSEGEYLIASGIGRLTYDDERHPFRWTLPYKDAGRAKDSTQDSDPWSIFDSMWHMAESAVMPLENVDFMGADQRIPERVRRLVCGMLESAAGPWGTLHSPSARVRQGLGFLISMNGELGPHDPLYFENLRKQGLKSREELDFYNGLSEHARLVQSLLDGTAESLGRTFRRAFELRKALKPLGDRLADELDDAGSGTLYDLQLDDPGIPDALPDRLVALIDDAIDAWSVGETREEEFTYHPFEWLEETEGPGEVGEEDLEYGEEASEDDEDELPNLDD